MGEADDAIGATVVGDSAGAAVSGAHAALLPRGATVGRYVILDHVGSGGMSVVYAAYDPQLDRKVAIKLLRSGDGDRERQQRLLREAQAMARLSHPNVLAVFDAGTYGDRVFIAAELVDGPTLRQWQDAEERSWRAVLDVYLEAGRGLASAHAAGLVHRDFKPQNVIIDGQGRARVLDFGLARTHAEVRQERHAPGGAELHAHSVLETPLTSMGALMGTPAYMSPEQLDGKPVDARSDQFSFCVALWEALHRQRPFAGETLDEVRRAVRAGKLREPPSLGRVPKRLRATLARGLSQRPEERFPSLDALLQALSRERSRGGWRVAAVGVGLAITAITVAAGITVSTRRAHGLCAGADDKLVSAWGAARRHAIADAFARSASPVAAETRDRVDAALDRYAHRWAAAWTDSCEATHVRGEQSAELLDLRMQCLGTRLAELRATTEILTNGGASIVTEGPRAVAGLSRIEDCADTAALRAPMRLPNDAAARATIARVRDEMAAAHAADAAGHFAPAVAASERAVAAARELHAASLEADALFDLAQARYHAGDGAAGIATMTDAALAATVARDDKLAARAWGQLVFYATETGRFDAADEWARLALAEAARAGNPATAMGRLYTNIATLRDWQRRHDEAIALYHRAIDAARAINDQQEVALATNDLADTLAEIGDDAEVVTLFQQAYEIWSRELGPTHPNTLLAQENLAWQLLQEGLLDAAEQSIRRDLQLREITFGHDHPAAEFALRILCDVEIARGQLAKASELTDREVDLVTKGYGDDSPLLVDAYRQRGEIALAGGHRDAARRAFERARGCDQRNDPLRSARIAYGLAASLERGDARARSLVADARQLVVGRKDRAAAALRTRLDAWR